MDSHTKLIRAEDVGLVKTDVFLRLDGELIQAHSLNSDLDQVRWHFYYNKTLLWLSCYANNISINDYTTVVA